MNAWQSRWRSKRILQRLAAAEARIDALEKRLRADGVVADERDPMTRGIAKPARREEKQLRTGNAKRRPVKQGAAQNVSEGAKLLAAQMAAAGIPEDEVNAFLNSTFDFGSAEDEGDHAAN